MSDATNIATNGNVISLPVAQSKPITPGAPLIIEPFLHVESDRIYNPLTDQALIAADTDYGALRQLTDGVTPVDSLEDSLSARLVDHGWLVEDQAALAARYFLKYVSLEAHTVCNQGCYFCPVSVKRRDDYFMSTEMYESIVAQLAEFRSTIEGVSMIHYNEPTLDKRFVDQVRLIKSHGLPPAVLTNATGLTKKKVDEILEAGGVSYLSVNLSTLNRERYAVEREGDHLAVVLRNVDYMQDKEIAPKMEIVVLGKGDSEHKTDFEEIKTRYQDSRFDVSYYEVMNRAGHVEVGEKPAAAFQDLRGCEQTGSRPLQWAHITPHGKLVLCCQDYDDEYVIGDLHEQPLREILSGEKMQKLRKWVYGLEEAPADFICRNCIYAITAN